MKKIALFAALAVSALANAVPVPMIGADIVEGQYVFPSVLPSLLTPQSAVTITSARYGNRHRLNLTTTFLTAPVIGTLASRLEISVWGFGSREAEFQLYDFARQQWVSLGRRTLMPTNPTRVLFVAQHDPNPFASRRRFISGPGTIRFRMLASDTRQFSYIMDFIGVNAMY